MKVYNLNNTHLLLHGNIINNVMNSQLDSFLTYLSNHITRLKRNNRYKNLPLTFIINGNAGFGKYEESYYQNIIKKHLDFFIANNCYVLFVRGNEDDPSYFSDEKISYSHIRTIPDYSVVITDNHATLCIGGSISHNKEWKINFQNYIQQFDDNRPFTLYWENEAMNINYDIINELSQLDVKIDTIVTAIPPSNAYPQITKTKQKTETESLIINERKNLSNFIEKLMEQTTLKLVAYSSNLSYHIEEQNINNQKIYNLLLPTDRSFYADLSQVLEDTKDNIIKMNFVDDFIECLNIKNKENE